MSTKQESIDVIAFEGDPALGMLLVQEIERTKTLKLPFPMISAPPLFRGRIGPWEIARNALPPMVRGYFRGMHAPESTENWVLRNWDERSVWMSIAPMEIESASHHVHAAKGDVLVGGLGIGMVLWALLNKPEVTSVTVIERDPRVIELMREVMRRNHTTWGKHLYSRSQREQRHTLGPRLDIIHRDLFDFAENDEHDGAFDFALIDIWSGVGDSALRPDMQRLAKTGIAEQYAAWGLEMDFVSWGMETGQHVEGLSKHGNWALYSDAIEVPLIGREWKWMSALAVQATINQTLDAIWDQRGIACEVITIETEVRS